MLSLFLSLQFGFVQPSVLVAVCLHRVNNPSEGIGLKIRKVIINRCVQKCHLIFEKARKGKGRSRGEERERVRKGKGRRERALAQLRTCATNNDGAISYSKAIFLARKQTHRLHPSFPFPVSFFLAFFLKRRRRRRKGRETIVTIVARTKN